nr:YbhB/YbcL family Raf kinase inhibitor-like protein [Planosporangium flavigriseum]
MNIKDLRVSSPDFAAGSRLDDVHAWDKDNVAPRLTIHGVPEGTVELAVVCHDPDAPLPFGFTHWTLYGIPPETTELDRDADKVFRAGPNGTGDPGYVGPLPPAGHGPHHYYFWVYALNTTVDGTPSREEFLERYGKNIIEQNRIVATYEN